MSKYDEYIRHIIDTEFYAEQVSDDLKKCLNSIRRRIDSELSEAGFLTKAGYRELLDECEDIVDYKLEEFFEDYEADRSAQALAERNYLKDFLKTVLGIAVGAVSVAGILKLTFNGKDDIKGFKERLKKTILNFVKTPSMSSMVFGTSVSVSKEQFSRQMDKLTKTACLDIKTDVTSIQRNVQKIVFLDTKIKYEYNSMLDSRTCVVCGGYSGSVYDSLNDAPSLPIHERCRCFYLPYDSEEENETYEEWLKKQPDSVIRKILGNTRYLMYKSGISIKSFTSEGHKLSLKELFEES